MDRLNWYFLQKVTNQELNLAFDQVEARLLARAVDTALTGVHGDLATALKVEQNGTPNQTVNVRAGVAYDQLGNRMSVASTTNVNVAVDAFAASTQVASSGNEKWVSLFLKFTRNNYDPRTDGNGVTVQFRRDASVTFFVKQGTEAPTGTATRPALEADGILLADILRTFNDNTIVDGDIDITRRQDAFVIAGSPTSIRRGLVKDAIADVLAALNAHVVDTSDAHDASAISFNGFPQWADSTTTGATEVEAALDGIVSALAGFTGAQKVGAASYTSGSRTVSAGSAKSQINAIVDMIAGLAAAEITYAGSGQWKDTTTVGAATVEAAIDEVVADLAADDGSKRIGSAATTSTFASGETLSAGSIYGQIDAILSALGDQSAPITGAGRIGNDAYTSGSYSVSLGTVRSQIQELVQQINSVSGGVPGSASALSFTPNQVTWADSSPGPATGIAATNVQTAINEVLTDLAEQTSTQASGSNRVGSPAISGLPGSLSAGSVRNQLGQLLTLINTGAGSGQRLFSVFNVPAGASTQAENTGVLQQTSYAQTTTVFLDEPLTAGSIQVAVYGTPAGGARALLFTTTVTAVDGNLREVTFSNTINVASYRLLDIEVVGTGVTFAGAALGIAVQVKL